MRILITGGSGMLGGELNKSLSTANHEILTLFNKNRGNTSLFNSEQLDFLDTEKIKKIFLDFQPEIVLHTGCISTPADADNLNPKLVNQINVKTTSFIAELCKLYNTKLICIKH